jgi:hypothetical protein
VSADDELAIRRLVAIYSDAITCRDPAAAATVFAEDGVLHAFSGPEVVGRDNIREALGGRSRARSDAEAPSVATAPAEPGFSIQLTRFVAVDFHGDTANGRSYYLEFSRGPERDSVGRYSTGVNEDTYVRTPEGWRIARRRLTRNYVGDMMFPGKTTSLEIAAWASGPDPVS